MSNPIKLKALEFAAVRATRRTEWFFAELTDHEGVCTVVEFTAGDNSPRVASALAEMVQTLSKKSIESEAEIPTLLGLDTAQLQADRGLATAVSALRNAVLQLQAEHQGASLTQALGGTPRKSVPLYANINRSLLEERTPEAFAAAAERVVQEGFKIVKCAPFDEVRPPSTPEAILDLAGPGIQRVAAVRSAVGLDIQVLVDCLSRFETHTAPIVAEELAKLSVGWFEEPVEPTKDQDGLAEISGKVSIPLAGGESGYGEDFFIDLVRRGAVRTVMPDIKYCGGVGVACRAGLEIAGLGGRVSLHSPSGPVSQLASAHCTAALGGDTPLEHAVNEVSWRSELVFPAERIHDGQFWLPDGDGLGAALNNDLVERYGRRWKP